LLDLAKPIALNHKHGQIKGCGAIADRYASRRGAPALGCVRRLVARSDVRRDGRTGQQHGVDCGGGGGGQRGVAGLLAGSFSMALGEYTSVTTANEQIDSEVRVEQKAFENHPHAERAELVAMLVNLGMSRETAAQATEEIHRDETRAVNFHLIQELGIDPSEKPSPWVAAISSFVMFAIGAIVPLIPYLLGYESLWAGVICGGIGLAIAGGVAARFTSRPIWWASLRQLLFGGVAIAATYLVGTLIGTVAA
jgi:vacuolar iron transporter family protein